MKKAYSMSKNFVLSENGKVLGPAEYLAQAYDENAVIQEADRQLEGRVRTPLIIRQVVLEVLEEDYRVWKEKNDEGQDS